MYLKTHLRYIKPFQTQIKHYSKKGFIGFPKLSKGSMINKRLKIPAPNHPAPILQSTPFFRASNTLHTCMKGPSLQLYNRLNPRQGNAQFFKQ